MKILAWLLALLPFILALKCERDCYPSKEPELKTIFQQNNVTINPTFQRVYDLHERKEIIKRKDSYHLPISLLTDSVTYIFENPGRTDTLTIYYTRNFFFESERCGYEVEIRQNSNRGQAVSSTFTDASVIFSDGNHFDRNIYALTIHQ